MSQPSESAYANTNYTPRQGLNAAYFDCAALPNKPLSVLNRAVPSQPSKKNIDSLDQQDRRDSYDFDRKAHIYRKDADKPFHHNRPASSITTLWEAGHIADRGKGRTHTPSDSGIFNPITSEYSMLPTPNPRSPRSTQAMVQEAWQEKDQQVNERADRMMKKQHGTYNPIIHVWTTEPDELLDQQHRKEFQSNHGGRGIKPKQLAEESYDPISGQMRRASSQNRRTESPENMYSYERPVAVIEERSSELHAEEYYNPMKNTWITGDDRRYGPSKERDEAVSISGQLRKRVPLPPSQGIYDPIRNKWVQIPSDLRAASGLAFRPATLFNRD